MTHNEPITPLQLHILSRIKAGRCSPFYDVAKLLGYPHVKGPEMSKARAITGSVITRLTKSGYLMTITNARRQKKLRVTAAGRAALKELEQ